VGLVVISPAKTKPFIFIQCIRNKGNNEWEKISNGEGRKVRISLEEMVMINQVLKGEDDKWEGYHPYKDRDPNISVSWEDGNKKKLWFNVGKYKKPFEFPQIEVLRLLFKHLITEKIEFATIASNIPTTNKILTTEENYAPDLDIGQKNSPIEIKTERIDYQKQDSRKIYGSIKTETEKALLLILQNGQEAWVPKSRIYSKYDLKVTTEQEFTIDNWVLEQKGITVAKIS
jgi:hypothetical protein